MGTRKNLHAGAVLTSTHNLCFEQKNEKYQNFYRKTLFLVVKFSMYLKWRDFVMTRKKTKQKKRSEQPQDVESDERKIHLFPHKHNKISPGILN